MTEWIDVASRGRDHPILTIDTLGRGINKGLLREVYEIDYEVKGYRQFDGSRSILKEDMEAIITILRKKTKEKPDLYYQIALRMKKLADQMKAETDKLKGTDWSTVSNDELASMIDQLLSYPTRFWAGGGIYTNYFFFNDIFFEEFMEKIKKRAGADFNKLVTYLTTPDEKTLMGEERTSLLMLAKESLANRRIDENKLEKHWRKYAYLKRYIFLGRGYTKEDMCERLDNEMEHGIQAIEEELEKLNEQPVCKFEFTDNEQLAVKSMKTMPVTSNYTDEIINYSLENLQGLFDEVGKRLGISYEELTSMLIKELLDSLRSGLCVPKDELRQRFEENVLIYTEGVPRVLIGKELQKYKEDNKRATITATEVTGAVANPGTVIRGEVRVVNSEKEVAEFKKGEILVTPMTNPSFVPAMQKAAAIVTDDGGMLCHAAVVSRELNVPCIVGTKHATKIFNDGDILEINAHTGIVKKVI